MIRLSLCIPRRRRLRRSASFLYLGLAFLLFFRPGEFFSNKYGFRKSLKYFLYSFLVFFLVQAAIRAVLGGGEVVALVLASLVSSLLFLASLLLFFGVLVLVYFIIFNYILKLEIKAFLLFTLMFFSLVPYILVNSISGFVVYDIVTLFGVGVGFLSFDVVFLWSLMLFSLGVSNELGLQFKKGLLFVFMPFLVIVGILVFVFYDAFKLNVFGLIFEKF